MECLLRQARRSGTVLAAAFWVLAAVILLYRLGDFPLKDWDEAIYAEVSREILRTGDIFTLYYNHDPFFDKPPLYFWVGHLAMRLLGFSEFSARLPGVLFGVLTLWATIRFGREVGGVGCGLASGTLLLSTAMFLENASRHASPDSLLLFLTVAALWAQWRGRRVPALRYVAVTLVGFAFLTKSAAAVPLLVILLLIHWLLADYRTWTLGAHVRAVLLLGAIVVPWYAVQTALHGFPFWWQHIGLMVWERATRTGFLYSRGSFYYVRFLIEQLTYLWPLGVMVLWMGVESRAWRQPARLPDFLRTHREVSLTLLLAITVPVVLFSAARNHTWWYILPAVPPLSVMGGLVLRNVARRMWYGMWRKALFGALLGLLVFNAVSHVTTALRDQIRNGIKVYGPQAQLAKKVATYAGAMGLENPVVFFPRDSPSIAAYIPFRVVFGPHYANNLNPGSLQVLSRRGIFLIDSTRAIGQVRRRTPVRVLEEGQGWALAVVSERETATLVGADGPRASR